MGQAASICRSHSGPYGIGTQCSTPLPIDTGNSGPGSYGLECRTFSARPQAAPKAPGSPDTS